MFAARKRFKMNRKKKEERRKKEREQTNAMIHESDGDMEVITLMLVCGNQKWERRSFISFE